MKEEAERAAAGKPKSISALSGSSCEWLGLEGRRRVAIRIRAVVGRIRAGNIELDCELNEQEQAASMTIIGYWPVSFGPFNSMPTSSRNPAGSRWRLRASLAAALLFTCSELAAQVVLSGELDTLTYDESNGYPVLSASVKPSFTLDFSDGETLLTATWSAPAGKMVVIETPADGGYARVDISVHGGSRPGAHFIEQRLLEGMSFENLTGSFAQLQPSVIEFSITGYYNISSYIELAGGERISFTSVSISHVVPEVFSEFYSLIGDVSFEIRGTLYDGMGEPGQWISLQDVGPAIPEPATSALIFGALAASAAFIIRHRRRGSLASLKNAC